MTLWYKTSVLGSFATLKLTVCPSVCIALSWFVSLSIFLQSYKYQNIEKLTLKILSGFLIIYSWFYTTEHLLFRSLSIHDFLCFFVNKINDLPNSTQSLNFFIKMTLINSYYYMTKTMPWKVISNKKPCLFFHVYVNISWNSISFFILN